jgi:hypothetical protein
MDTNLKVPAFATEAEEADWWYDNRHLVEQEFLKAAAEGRLGRGTAVRRAEENRAKVQAKPVPVLLTTSDEAKAKRIAAKRGVSYEEYLAQLLHQELEKVEEPASAA